MGKKSIKQREAKIYAEEYVNFLRKKYDLNIQAAFLFGSHAKKQANVESDIDVAIISPLFKKTNPLFYLWKRRRDIDIARGIEPYGLSPDALTEGNPIASEIKKFGLKIW